MLMFMDNSNGNALFLILIAVALFAALSYAVTQSGRGGGSIDRETAELNAAQIVQYMGAMQSAVQKLQLYGCGEDGISFHDAAWGHTDYQHSVPADSGCNVFSSDGGGMNFPSVPTTISSLQWEIDSKTRVWQTGNDGVDLLMYLPGLSEDMCLAINRGLGHSFTSVPTDAGDLYTPPGGRYDGNYTGGDNINGASNGCPDDLCGLHTACFREVGGGQNYIYYQVLIDR